MEAKLRATILDYLEKHNTLTLATAGDGQPWATALYYVNDGFNLYILSKPETRHCQNLAQNPAVAVTINEDYKNWREIKGIQMEGRAYQLSGRGEKARAWALYLRKYPFVKDFIMLPRFKEALESVKLYKIVPTAVWFIDNTKGYFNKQKIELNPHSGLTPQ